MNKLIQVHNLSFEYTNTKIFHQLSFEIEEGSFVSFVGNNKSGKTTLMKLLAGILPSNQSIIAGYSYVNDNRVEEASMFYGICFSSMNDQFLFEDVYQELAFPLENLNYKKEEIKQIILELTEQFNNRYLLDQQISNLLLSEKQELLLMLALIHQPRVLLLDHSFCMVKGSRRQELFEILKRMQREKSLTIILATTNLEDGLYSDYTYVLYGGNIVMEGRPILVFQEEKILNRVGLEIPLMIDLSMKLQFYEVLDKVITDIDGMVNTLWN